MRIGVDVGGTSIRLRVFPGDDRLEEETEALGAEEVAGRIATLTTRLMSRAGRPQAVGVGIPGQVDAEAGTVRHAVNLGIDGTPFPLGEYLASRLDVPVHLENDVRAAALGAFHLLRPERPALTSLVYLSAGTGVSAGVVVDGRVFRGRHGIAGEIGHAPLGDESIACSCGLAGCLEAVVGGRSLDRRVAGGARSLFRQPSPAPQEAGRVVHALARALYLLAATYDPDLLVLGGGIGHDALPAVREVLDGMSAASPFGEEVLTPDRVIGLPADADAGVYGAARLGPDPSRSDAPESISAAAEEEQGGNT